MNHDIITKLIRKRIELEISDEVEFQTSQKCLTFQNEFDILQKFAERAKSFTANKSKKVVDKQ